MWGLVLNSESLGRRVRQWGGLDPWALAEEEAGTPGSEGGVSGGEESWEPEFLGQGRNDQVFGSLSSA